MGLLGGSGGVFGCGLGGGGGAFYQFDVGHGGSVAAAGAQFDDASVAAGPVFEAGGDFVEEAADDFFVVDDGGGLAAGVESAAFAEGDHALGDGSDGLGLGLSGDDGFVSEEFGDLVADESGAVGAAAAEGASGFSMAHCSVSGVLLGRRRVRQRG